MEFVQRRWDEKSTGRSGGSTDAIFRAVDRILTEYPQPPFQRPPQAPSGEKGVSFVVNVFRVMEERDYPGARHWILGDETDQELTDALVQALKPAAGRKGEDPVFNRRYIELVMDELESRSTPVTDELVGILVDQAAGHGSHQEAPEAIDCLYLTSLADSDAREPTR